MNIDIETNKNDDYLLNVQKSKRKSCCVINKYTILTSVIICIVIVVCIVIALRFVFDW